MNRMVSFPCVCTIRCVKTEVVATYLLGLQIDEAEHITYNSPGNVISTS